MKRTKKVACLAAALPYCLAGAQAHAQGQDQGATVTQLESITVEASADASAQGLSPAFAGGQVARGGRAGILGTRDNMDTPFSITSYTSEFIQDRQARSVGDVLQADPGVRVARGFGNFQESYFIRGFILSSDDVAYNGLYSLLPRQYIAAELFERVEVLRGASAFLTGATPGGGGIGGVINLLPKRASNEPLTRITTGWSSDAQGQVAADIARRFGPEGRLGLRINAAAHGGETGVDHERNRLGVGSVGVDWRGNRLRLSGDIGWQDHRLKQPRPNLSLDGGVTSVPRAPDAKTNYAQPWTYSDERDVFGSLRGEYDLADKVTAWAAYGMRKSKEANSLSSTTVIDSRTGDATFYRFDNARKDKISTGEVGMRAKLRTGPVGHELVASAAFFEQEVKNAYVMDWANALPTNIYDPVYYDRPVLSPGHLAGNDLDSPALQWRTRLASYAIGDSLSFLDDRILLTLGVRHQRLYYREYAYDTRAPGKPYEKRRNSPAAGVVFKLSPQVSLYANYIEGLAQGDTAPAPAINQGESLPPYVSRQKEIGLKYEGDGLGAGLALFTTKRPRGYIDADNVFSAGGEDRHRGIELTVFGEPVRGVRVLGGLTWLDAKQVDTGDGALDGKRVIGVPRMQANMGVEWDIPGVPGLTVDGRVVYTGARYADAANTLRAPSWTRLDAGLRYVTDIDGRMLVLRARVENLTNRDYWMSVGGYPGSGYLVLGAPRTFMLSASMEF